jgi:hypothetical protein
MSNINAPYPWAVYDAADERVALVSLDEIDIFSEFGEVTNCSPMEAFAYLDRAG